MVYSLLKKLTLGEAGAGEALVPLGGGKSRKVRAVSKGSVAKYFFGARHFVDFCQDYD